MTRSLLLALALSFSLAACADDPAPPPPPVEAPAAEAPAAQVVPPTAVAEAFAAAHPDATDVEWSMEDGGYEAEFTEGGESRSMDFRADGTAGAMETEIPIASLPAAVTVALARDYAGAEVTEAARIVDGDVTTYEAEITRNGTPQDLIFHEDGTLVETKAAEPGDNDDDDE